jgi:hypothetical protein
MDSQKLGSSSTVNEAPYDKNYDRTYDRTNKPSALIWPVPADCLAEKSGDEGPNNSKDRRQNEPGGLIGTGVKPFSDKTRKEPDYGDPKVMQHVSLRFRPG